MGTGFEVEIKADPSLNLRANGVAAASCRVASTFLRVAALAAPEFVSSGAEEGADNRTTGNPRLFDGVVVSSVIV